MKYIHAIMFIIVLLLSSCSDDDSNDITRIMVFFYDNKNDNHLRENSLTPKLGEDYLKNLKIKIIPCNNDKLKNITRTFSYRTDEIAVPLHINSEYHEGENNRMVKVSKNPEEFEYILIYKDEIIFKKTFQFFYKNGNPWEIVSRVNIKKGDMWEGYNPEKIEIIKNGESTGVFFEVSI